MDPSEFSFSNAVPEATSESPRPKFVPSAEKAFESMNSYIRGVDATVADHILGDQPAATHAEDRLGFAPYVQAVAKFLTDPSTKIPLTLSVEGLWGSGKSSFMLLLQEELGRLGKKKIVSFNAWQYNADDGLWAAFIHEFDEKLNASLTSREKLVARWRLFRLRLSWQEGFESAKTFLWLLASVVALMAIGLYLSHGGIAEWKHAVANSGKPEEETRKALTLIGGAGGTIAAVMLFLNQVKELFKSPASLDRTVKLFAKPGSQQKLPLIHEVTRDFQSLVTAHAGNENVFVFIDDLDRCEYTKAAELMQAMLTLLSSSPRVALIIGLDREKVAAAMAAKQEKLLPYLYKVPAADTYKRGMEYGQRFIEKFIQVSYILPSAQSGGLKAMVNPEREVPNAAAPESEKSVEAINVVTGKDDSGTMDEMVDMANAAFDHNPRNIKQFVNMFRLQVFIANETGLFGSSRARTDDFALTVPQLGKFVALCMRWPGFVETASRYEGLMGEVEKAIGIPTGEKPTAEALEIAKEWLNDPSFRSLIAFKLGFPVYTMNRVDFQGLSAISPARARTAARSSEAPTAVPSAPAAVSDTASRAVSVGLPGTPTRVAAVKRAPVPSPTKAAARSVPDKARMMKK
jgi:phenylpyruvate tautomerase PptA (4-oxalocrotonate tautomerase family)